MKRESHHSAGVVLFRAGSERQYLLLRSALTRRPVWEFPKGGLEAGETELNAAQRELEEETGLEVADYTIIDDFLEEERYTFTRGSGDTRRLVHKKVTYFLAKWHQGEVRISREASRYVWATLGEAERLLRFPEKRRVLAAAEARLVHYKGREHDDAPVIR